MSFDWKSYYTLAQQWYQIAAQVSAPDKEAYYRCSISRAYYAAYCLARNFAIKVDKQSFGSDDHQKVKNHFKNHSDEIRKTIGNKLNTTRDDRNLADYEEVLYEGPQLKAGKTLKRTREIITLLDQLWQKQNL